MKNPILLSLLVCLTILSCNSKQDIKVNGYAPIYSDKKSTTEVRIVNSPSKITSAGRIVTQGNTIYVVESGLGIHILEYYPSQPPKHVGFIECLGCSDLAIRENKMYTNNMTDLVVLDISQRQEPKVVGRNKDVFQNTLADHPPLTGFYFECPRDNDSVIVGWNLQVLENPGCYYE